jgi:hypothetical protein
MQHPEVEKAESYKCGPLPLTLNMVTAGTTKQSFPIYPIISTIY